MVPTGCGRPSPVELLRSGTLVAVGNQRAALISKQLDGVRRAGRGGASHITLSYILT